MRVRCVKIIDKVTGEEKKYSRDFTIGKTYTVLRVIHESERKSKIYLQGDDEMLPFYVSTEQFELVDDTIPPNWVVDFVPGKYMQFGPKAWLEDGFFERFVDDDSEAIEIFERERAIIEAAHD